MEFPALNKALSTSPASDNNLGKKIFENEILFPIFHRIKTKATSKMDLTHEKQLLLYILDSFKSEEKRFLLELFRSNEVYHLLFPTKPTVKQQMEQHQQKRRAPVIIPTKAAIISENLQVAASKRRRQSNNNNSSNSVVPLDVITIKDEEPEESGFKPATTTTTINLPPIIFNKPPLRKLVFPKPVLNFPKVIRPTPSIIKNKNTAVLPVQKPNEVTDSDELVRKILDAFGEKDEGGKATQLIRESEGYESQNEGNGHYEAFPSSSSSSTNPGFLGTYQSLNNHDNLVSNLSDDDDDNEDNEQSETTSSMNFYNFELRTTQNGNQKLILLDPEDNRLCYKFYYEKAKKYFRCSNCHSRGKSLTAWLRKDSLDIEYIRCRNDHVCTPMAYTPEDLEMEVIREPMFEFIYGLSNSRPRLVVYLTEDKDLCYTYTYYDKTKDVFVCQKCKSRKINKHVTAKMGKDSNGESFIRLRSPHFCEPIESSTLQRETIVKPGEYEYTDGPESVMTIFDSSNRNFCFTYNIDKRSGTYICIACKFNHNKLVSAKIVRNEKKEEYVVLNNYHECSPECLNP